MTKHITVKLTEDQILAIDDALLERISSFTEFYESFEDGEWYKDQRPFLRRIRTKLAKAKS